MTEGGQVRGRENLVNRTEKMVPDKGTDFWRTIYGKVTRIEVLDVLRDVLHYQDESGHLPPRFILIRADPLHVFEHADDVPLE
ncbi:MAG: hypothetical protein JWN51_3505 [Phycisphaerales bacterium]|nr:hypothetical protein [Phycisphaerales bacterium]